MKTPFSEKLSHKIVSLLLALPFTLLCLLSFLFLYSCSSSVDAPLPPAGKRPVKRIVPPDYEHVVRYRGETLSLIAKWYTGSIDNWRRLLPLNPGLRPDRIAVGQKIVVPGGLMVRDEPLPRNFIGTLAKPSIAGPGDSKSAPAVPRRAPRPSAIPEVSVASPAEAQPSPIVELPAGEGGTERAVEGGEVVEDPEEAAEAAVPEAAAKTDEELKKMLDDLLDSVE